VSSGHPSDADRERAASTVVDHVVAAIETGRVALFGAVLAENCVCLVAGQKIEGKDKVVAHLSTTLPGAREVTRRQQQGAHAVVGWSGGSCVLEIRRAEVIFAALA
jgi:hypothetical protein